MVLIYTVFSSLSEARKIGRALLKAKLAACVNFWPVESMYWWKGKLEKNKEVVMLIKTRKGNYTKAQRFIKAMHSYDTPAIFEIDVDMVERKYAGWIRKVTS